MGRGRRGRGCGGALPPAAPSAAAAALALAAAVCLPPLPGAAAFEVPGSVHIPPDVQFPGTYRHSVEVRPDGSVWVSGRNDFGQLGDGTTVNAPAPVKVKAASARFIPGVPVKLQGLGPRDPPTLDILDGQAGDLEEYDYESERWIVRMHVGSGYVRLLYAAPEELESSIPLDRDVPPSPTSSRRRSGCRITDVDRSAAWVVHDDGSRNLIEYPTDTSCITQALPVPAATLRMYLPRYGLGKEGYALLEENSLAACANAPPCTACNSYDVGEVCPNDFTCNPPLGAWQHEKCRLKFQPGMQVFARQLRLVPQIELNKRTGFLTQYDLRYGVEWEVKLSPISCLSGLCDSGNVISVSVPLHLIAQNGEAYAASAGAFHSVFLWTDTAVWAAGRNDQGQLGDGTTVNRVFPKFILFGAKAVAAGFYHSVYLLKNGTVMAAGRNKEGQLGDGTTSQRRSPVAVLDGVKDVKAGALHSVYFMEDNSVWATGSNTYGQLGDGGTVTQLRPVKVMENVISVECGDYYTLFVMWDPVAESNTMWAAGMFDSGLGRSKAAWEPLQFFNASEVQRMSTGAASTAGAE